jgi:Nucleotidyltransferase domain
MGLVEPDRWREKRPASSSQPVVPAHSLHTTGAKVNRIRSRWRDDELWEERVRDDRATLQDRLSGDEIEGLDGVVRHFEEDADFNLRFVVVYGSRATGEHEPESDLDIWVEATIPREIRFQEGVFDTMILPAGALLTAAHEGQTFAQNVASEGRVWADPDGWFRDTVIAADELAAR